MKDRAEEERAIDRYISGEMSGSEYETFEEKVANDPILRKRVEEHRSFLEHMTAFKNRAILKDKLERIHLQAVPKEITKEVREVSFFKRHYKLLAAAVIALIAMAGTVYTLSPFSVHEEKQAVQYQMLKKEFEEIKTSQHEILKEIKENQVEILPAKYSGTGFVISKDGYLATSYHLINGAKKLTVNNVLYGQIEVDTFFVSDKTDVAILKLKGQKFRSLPYGINMDDVEIGEKVFTLGYPRADIVYGEGYISSATGYNGDTSAYQVSIPVNPGNSGGPLFDESGNVTGIISGRQTATEGAGFATRIEMLGILQLADVKFEKKHTWTEKGRKQLVRQIRDYIFEVRVVE